MNDIEVNECCLKIHQLARQLGELQAQNKELKLLITLSDIQKAAEKAQYRLNDLKPLPPLVLPQSQGPVSG